MLYTQRFMLSTYVGIGTYDSIIPMEHREPSPLYGLNECIVTSGKLIFDAFLNLSRKELNRRDLITAKELFEVAEYEYYRLFCYKQRLVNSKKALELPIKQHIAIHFFPQIVQDGMPSNYNTVVTEKIHKNVAKVPYAKSSKRPTDLYEEMLSEVQTRKFLQIVNGEYKSLYGNFPVLSTAILPQQERVSPYKEYVTREGVIFKYSKYVTNSESLKYNIEVGKLVTVTGRAPSYLSPHVTLDELWHLFDTGFKGDFIDNFKRGNSIKNIVKYT
jgi:hypothetical protein